MKLTASMEKALNEQVVKEFHSAYLYLSMAKDMKREGFPGYAAWLTKQYNEEREHALKLSDYIEDRDGTTEFGAIDAITTHFECPVVVAEAALKHEEYISDSIRTLFKKARAEGDLETEVFLQWYITEQVEEEANAHDVLSGFTASHEDTAALHHVDHFLGKRKD